MNSSAEERAIRFVGMTERVATALRQQRHVLTRRYMHLSPASLDATIRLLERRGNNEALAGEPRPVWGRL